jgi:opine dehydrogenase
MKLEVYRLKEAMEMRDNPESYTVIGAGNGGKAMAAHLALMGFTVTLFNRTPEHVAAIKARGGIDLESTEGGPSGFGKLSLVTSEIGEAVKNAEMIMVVVPSSAHADIARSIAPHLRNGQTIVLNPGRTFGAIEFVKLLKDLECNADVTVAEAETLIYVSRSEGPSKARIFTMKEAVPLAALPATRTNQVLKTIRQVYPQFIDGINVLQTGLNNMGAIFHPAMTLLNTGWIEATHGDFQFYVDGVTPSVARVIEDLDRERVAVASSLGIRARTALEWLHMSYKTTGKDLREALRNQPGYYGIKAPSTINHRYIFEDVPMGLVPIASLGKSYGASVRRIVGIIRLASMIHHIDYWRCGRTVDRLGLAGLSVNQLTRYVNEGVVD